MDELNRARPDEDDSAPKKREYKRDPKGSSTGGQFTKDPNSAKGTSDDKRRDSPGRPEPKRDNDRRDSDRDRGPAKTPNTDKGTAPRRRRRGPPPLELGAKNDPDRVRDLQRLLKALGIANLEPDGTFGPDTERGVMALQRKLGMTETGRVSATLLKRLRDAQTLSPCADAKRAQEVDLMDELIRGVMGADIEDLDDEEVEDEEFDEGERSRLPVYRSADEYFRGPTQWALDDIHILRSGAGGDGRTVEAYIAVFDKRAQIDDQHGKYWEEVDRASFNRTLSHGIDRLAVHYHHGMTLHGTPSDLGSVPIGHPKEITPDGRGLRVIDRYNTSPLAESVLASIHNGDPMGYSFRGRIFRSNPSGRVPRVRPGEPLPVVRRMELGLSEYGPTPTPYYADARVLAVRSAQAVAKDLVSMEPELRREVITILSRSTPLDPEPETATPTEGPGAEDPPQEALRSAVDYRRLIELARIRGVFSEHDQSEPARGAGRDAAHPKPDR